MHSHTSTSVACASLHILLLSVPTMSVPQVRYLILLLLAASLFLASFPHLSPCLLISALACPCVGCHSPLIPSHHRAPHPAFSTPASLSVRSLLILSVSCRARQFVALSPLAFVFRLAVPVLCMDLLCWREFEVLRFHSFSLPLSISRA